MIPLEEVIDALEDMNDFAYDDVAKKVLGIQDAASTPPPQVIRTVEELAALDPDTLLLIGESGTSTWEPRDLIRFKLQGGSPFPAVVVAPAEQVRAARKALEEA